MGKIRRLDHIAVAVKNLDDAIERFGSVLGAKLIRKKEIKLSGSRICVAYLKLGDTIIALDQATDPDGFVTKFIERRGEGLHHLGFEVDDLDEFKTDLQKKGVQIPHEEEPGGVRKEILLSPKDLCGVLCQVMEWTEKESETMEGRINRLIQSLDRWE